MTSTNDILAIVLGGGRGTRLYPLTPVRSKPAVPIAGKYRLIDIPISNCINSGIFPHCGADPIQLGLAAPPHLPDLQFRRLSPRLGADLGGRADHRQRRLVPGHGRCRAQAVLRNPAPPGAQYVLILAGDHLYRMDYAPMGDFHGRITPTSPWLSSRWRRWRRGGSASSNATRNAASDPLCRKTQRPGGAG